MSADESAIKDLQQAWFKATMEGDADSVAALMTDDVVFLTPGRVPFGKREFLKSFEMMRERVSMRCEGVYEEIVISGDIAHARARLEISVTPVGGTRREMAGYALSVFRRGEDGVWRLSRDANLVAPKSDGNSTS